MISIVTKITIIAILILAASLDLNPEHFDRITRSWDQQVAGKTAPQRHYFRVVTGRVAFQPQQDVTVYITITKSSEVNDYQVIDTKWIQVGISCKQTTTMISCQL